MTGNYNIRLVLFEGLDLHVQFDIGPTLPSSQQDDSNAS